MGTVKNPIFSNKMFRIILGLAVGTVIIGLITFFLATNGYGFWTTAILACGIGGIACGVMAKQRKIVGLGIGGMASILGYFLFWAMKPWLFEGVPHLLIVAEVAQFFVIGAIAGAIGSIHFLSNKGN